MSFKVEMQKACKSQKQEGVACPGFEPGGPQTTKRLASFLVPSLVAVCMLWPLGTPLFQKPVQVTEALKTWCSAVELLPGSRSSRAGRIRTFNPQLMRLTFVSFRGWVRAVRSGSCCWSSRFSAPLQSVNSSCVKKLPYKSPKRFDNKALYPLSYCAVNLQAAQEGFEPSTSPSEMGIVCKLSQ